MKTLKDHINDLTECLTDHEKKTGKRISEIFINTACHGDVIARVSYFSQHQWEPLPDDSEGPELDTNDTPNSQ